MTASGVTRWEAAAQTAWGSYLTAAELRVLRQGLALAPPTGDAMEVGCEGGRWSRQILDRRGSVICTDVDPDVLALCAERLPAARCILVDKDDDRLPAQDGELGALLVYEVPVLRTAWFPREAARVVASGGVLVLCHINPMSHRALAYRAATLLGRRSRSWGIYDGPSYASLRSSLRAARFEIVHEEGLAWMPFTRQSDSSLIPAAVRLESALGLRRLVTISPWVLAVARRV